MPVLIHIPVRAKDCECGIFECACRLTHAFVSMSQFRRHAGAFSDSALLAHARRHCPKCGRPLGNSKGNGWNRVKVGDRLAHKDCSIVDEGAANADRRRALAADRREHRAAVRDAILRGDRLA